MNTIKQTLFTIVPELFYFRPKPELYKTLKIGQKRLGQILRNEKEPTYNEVLTLANYYKVPTQSLMDITALQTVAPAPASKYIQTTIPVEQLPYIPTVNTSE
jgi:hypothetical protein